MFWVIGVLFILFILKVPIAFALGISTLLGIIVSDIDFIVIPQKILSGVDSYALIAVPLFILAGELMTQGGISKRLVNFSQTLFGHMTSGLAIVAVVASVFFSAVSGSAIATTAAIGGMMIPAMLNSGYDKRFTASLIPAAGTIGPIIPPSIIMILYGVMANVSIGDLFLAGFIPGILMGVGLIAYAYIIGKKRGYKGRDTVASPKEMLVGLKDAILALLMPFIIIGGIVGGIFTPTESGVVAVVYALIIGMFVYKEINLKSLPKIFYDSAMTTAGILFIIGNAALFTWLITINNIPQQVGEYLGTFTDSPFLLLLVMNIILLIVGTFLDTMSALIIFTPLMLPLALAAGVDPIHFGIIMAVNLTIGMITPPMGVCLFVSTAIAKIKMQNLMKDLVPMVIILVVVLAVITYIPEVSLIVPKLFGA